MQQNVPPFNNPMMGMFGSAAPTAACAATPQQDIMTMFMQWMMQMMQGQMPQMMMQMFQQMMQQMNLGQNTQPQTTSATSPQSEEHQETEVDKHDLTEEYLTVKQTAKLLHVTEVTLWRWHRDEKLMRHKVGDSRVLYKRDEVYNFINSQNIH